jgi:N-acetylglucosaminyl-diphospho-decaprenol L-rhamnosyltransferase
MVTVSVVSHGHGHFISDLLDDLRNQTPDPGRVTVVVTYNIPEAAPIDSADYPFSVTLRTNTEPKGFGINHNAAFAAARTPYFAVLNPDMRLYSDPFRPLMDWLDRPEVGVAAPVVKAPDGSLQDSARRFPTPFSIAAKDYSIDGAEIRPDWAAGMFMVFRSEVFRRIGGFDEGYHLYYEDVDICARLRQAGLEVVVDPRAQVTHFGARRSHRDMRYLRWHLASMMRFFARFPIGGPRRPS